MTTRTYPDRVVEDDVAPVDGELVECAGCGIKGRWVDGTVINPGPGDAEPWCSADVGAARVRLRAHGPWLPIGGDPS